MPTMRYVLITCSTAAAALTLAGCGGGETPTGTGNGNGVGSATSITLVSGDAQSGGRSTTLGSPLVVKVSDAQGNGVSGVTVDWEVTLGAGTLSAASATTDAGGQASVTYDLGHLPGANTVTASSSGLSGSPVTFAAAGVDMGPVTVTVEMSGTAFVAPGGGDDITILLGDTIEWVNRDGVQHTATSSSEPAGGVGFDSPFLNQGQTFVFEPAVTGTWVYFCRVHPATMVDAMITVQ